jgi:hypothetical protein
VAPADQVIMLGTRSSRPMGMPEAMPLAAQDVRLHVPVLDRPHFAGAPGARLDLVGDEQDAVSSQILRRRGRNAASGMT